MKQLFMTVGLPRSGKSTWALAQNGVPIVNPDSIRLAIHGKAFDIEFENLVWWHARIMVKSLFISGHDKVILDATSVTVARRNQWKGDWERHFVVFEPPIDICKLRAINTDQQYLLSVIDKMAMDWEPVTADEGTILRRN